MAISIHKNTGTITIYPTKIVIDGYNERNNKIEKSLSVWNSTTFSYDFEAFIYEEDKNRLTIPSGYPINWVLSNYPNYEVINLNKDISKILDTKKYLKPIKMKYDCRDKIQEDAYKFLNRRYRGTRFMQRYLCLDTGYGKTFVTVKYIVDNNDRPIIFVDNLNLADQWINRITEYTDTTKDEIYFISGKDSINKLMKMSDKDVYNYKFFICCYRTLTTNLKNTNTTSDVVNIFNKINITLKVFDEAHIEYMSIFKMDMLTDVRTIYLSATPMRSDPSEDKVYQRMFKTVERFGNKKEKYHHICVCTWNSSPSMNDEAKCATYYGFSMSRYCNYLENVAYDRFEEKLYDLIFNFILAKRKKKKMAILFGTNSLLDKFYDNLVTYINTQGYKLKVGKLNGTVKKKEKEDTLLNSDIIITTDKSFDKGIDVKGLRVLINTVPFSSESKLIQVIGRLRYIPDKKVYFFDINDLGFGSIKHQLDNKMSKVYKKLGETIYVKEL